MTGSLVLGLASAASETNDEALKEQSQQLAKAVLAKFRVKR